MSTKSVLLPTKTIMTSPPLSTLTSSTHFEVSSNECEPVSLSLENVEGLAIRINKSFGCRETSFYGYAYSRGAVRHCQTSMKELFWENSNTA